MFSFVFISFTECDWGLVVVRLFCEIVVETENRKWLWLSICQIKHSFINSGIRAFLLFLFFILSIIYNLFSAVSPKPPQCPLDEPTDLSCHGSDPKRIKVGDNSSLHQIIIYIYSETAVKSVWLEVQTQKLPSTFVQTLSCTDLKLVQLTFHHSYISNFSWTRTRMTHQPVISWTTAALSWATRTRVWCTGRRSATCSGTERMRAPPSRSPTHSSQRPAAWTVSIFNL